MKAALISLGSKSSMMVAEAMKKYFEQVDMLDLTKIEVNLSKQMEVLYEGKPISHYDCIYAKGSFRYNQLLRSIASSLYHKAYMPIRPIAYSIAQDKIYTQTVIQKNNIPMPTTYLSATIDAAKNILKKVNYPIIMKFPQGTQGKGVMFADSYASASSILDALESLRQPFLIQEYVETDGVDIRLIVVGQKVVAAMKRRAEVGEKRANLHAGGAGEKFIPDEYTKKIAVEAARSIGAEICGVDVLESVKGPVVIEVNVSPGLQGITSVTDIEVADRIAKYLFEQAGEKKESSKKVQATEIMRNISTENNIITHLDFRGNRILLPEFATRISKLGEKQEVCVTTSKDQIVIKKM